MTIDALSLRNIASGPTCHVSQGWVVITWAIVCWKTCPSVLAWQWDSKSQAIGARGWHVRLLCLSLNLLPYCEWFLLSLAFTVWIFNFSFNLLGMHIMIIKCKLLLSMDDAKKCWYQIKIKYQSCSKESCYFKRRCTFKLTSCVTLPCVYQFPLSSLSFCCGTCLCFWTE